MRRSVPAALWAVCLLAVGCANDGATVTATTTTTTPGPLARYAHSTSAVYADPAHWLCRPDTVDVCDTDLDSTVVAADGTLTTEAWHADPQAPIDCFYVYPTISRDPGVNSDLVPSPEAEGLAAHNQVARLGSECRVFAPVYRQVTLGALTGRLNGTASTADAASGADVAYADVLDAWKQYMAKDNDGRGVVLIGHSQGAGQLIRLMKEEIDPHPDVVRVLVAAYLAGGSVRVPEGRDVGGDFAHIPMCRTADQVGCAVSWASFRSTAPPPATSFFGKPRGGGPGVAACVNPASLRGGSARLHSFFRAAGGSILGSSASKPWVDPSIGTVTTPFVQTPGLVTGECTSSNGFNYLSVTIHGDPTDPRVDDIGGDLTPEWGLHLQDVNLVMGDVVALVGSQSAAWRARK